MNFKDVMDRIFGQRIKDTVDEGLKKVDARVESLKGTEAETRKEVEAVVKEAEKVAGFFQGAGPDLISLLAKTEGRIIVVPVSVGIGNYPRVTVDGEESQYAADRMDEALKVRVFTCDRARCLRQGITPGKTYQFIAMLVPKEGA